MQQPPDLSVSPSLAPGRSRANAPKRRASSSPVSRLSKASRSNSPPDDGSTEDLQNIDVSEEAYTNHHEVKVPEAAAAAFLENTFL